MVDNSFPVKTLDRPPTISSRFFSKQSPSLYVNEWKFAVVDLWRRKFARFSEVYPSFNLWISLLWWRSKSLLLCQCKKLQVPILPSYHIMLKSGLVSRTIWGGSFSFVFENAALNVKPHLLNFENLNSLTQKGFFWAVCSRSYHWGEAK